MIASTRILRTCINKQSKLAFLFDPNRNSIPKRLLNVFSLLYLTRTSLAPFPFCRESDFFFIPFVLRQSSVINNVAVSIVVNGSVYAAMRNAFVLVWERK